MKKKFFHAYSSKRIAYCLLLGTAILFTCLGSFYVRNQTLPYYQSLESNRWLAIRNNILQSEEEYLQQVGIGEKYLKRANLQRAYSLARANGMIGATKVSIDQIKHFFADFELPSKGEVPTLSVFEQDKITEEMGSLLSLILKKSDELEYINPDEFELKRQVFARLSNICNSMDGHGSYVGVLTRARSTEGLLQQVHNFQVNTVASRWQKDRIVDSALPVLTKPYDLKFMFQFEYLRTQTMIDVLNGDKKISRESLIFREPKDLSFSQKFVLAVPGVKEAWESKFNSSLARVIIQCNPDPLDTFKTDEIILLRSLNDSNMNHTNYGYLDHFGFTEMIQSMAFNHNDWYKWKIVEKQKLDRKVIVASLK